MKSCKVAWQWSVYPVKHSLVHGPTLPHCCASIWPVVLQWQNASTSWLILSQPAMWKKECGCEWHALA